MLKVMEMIRRGALEFQHAYLFGTARRKQLLS